MMFPSENNVIAMWPTLFEEALTSVVSKSSDGKWDLKIEARRWFISRAKEIIYVFHVSSCDTLSVSSFRVRNLD